MSRFTGVRLLSWKGFGPPQVLDRGSKAHAPHLYPNPGKPLDKSQEGTLYDEWYRSKTGIWMPTMRGGSMGFRQHPRSVIGGGDTWGGTLQSFDYTTPFVFNSTGHGIGHRYTSPVAKTLAKVYYYTTNRVGTPGALTLEFRRNNTHNQVVTGSTLLGTQSVTPSTTFPRWNMQAVSVANFGGHATDKYFQAYICDPAGNATNYWGIARAPFMTAPLWGLGDSMGIHTTNGWLTTTLSTYNAGMGFVFSDGSAIGAPWVAAVWANPGANIQQGLRINDGFVGDFPIHGIHHISGTSAPTTVYIWEGSAGPNSGVNLMSGVPFINIPESTAVGTPNLWIFGSRVTLKALTPYRITIDGPATGGVYRLQVGTIITGTLAELMSMVLGGGQWYATTESGAVWSDNTAEFPLIDLILDDIGAAAAASGGLRMAGRGGLATAA